MISSRVLSRLLPVAEGDVSSFDGTKFGARRMGDREAGHPDSLNTPFRDHDEDPERLLFDGDLEQSPDARLRPFASPKTTRISPKWLQGQTGGRVEEDDDVPESLLLDSTEDHGPGSLSRPQDKDKGFLPHPKTQTRSQAAQEQTCYQDDPLSSRGGKREVVPRIAKRERTSYPRQDPHAEAMWLWTNASNPDAFLLEVYHYYVEHGVYSILLKRMIGQLTKLFVFSFAMFLTTCVDYSLIPASKSTSEVMIPQCMAKASWTKSAILAIFIMYWCWTTTTYIRDTPHLIRMRKFYEYGLGIADSDIQTVSWVRVVEGLVQIANANPATANAPSNVPAWMQYPKPQQRLNAESIANRLMRRDNFYVAMYNKDIFDFTLPLPFFGARQFYSKSLEWCIDFCFTNFIFDEQGNIRPFALEIRNRASVAANCRRRLQFAALISILIAPINILWFCVMYFFRYYTEFTRNPSKVSARSFTPFAEWKIRQFNELDHLFHRRLRQAFPFANEYLKQFPKDKTDQFCRFVAFVSGALAAVLAIATLLDHELFLGFEVTPGRTAVFWLTLTVGIFGFAHGMLPEEHEVHDPVFYLKEVLIFTHYLPAHWKGRLHSNEVREEFAAMFQLKIFIFVEEILSLIVAPWILLRNANTRAERIADFFREQTLFVEGIGHQCNFAVFSFKKEVNFEDPTAALGDVDGLCDEHYGLKDDKMAASVQNFMQYYSHCNPRQGLRKNRGWQLPPAWPRMLSPSTPGEPSRPIRPSNMHAYPPDNPRRTAPVSDFPPQQRTHTSLWSPPSATPVQLQRMRPDQSQKQAGAKTAKNGIGEISESRIMAQDSDLHDYANGPGTKGETQNDPKDLDVGVPPEGEFGVIGMLMQFGKVQTGKSAPGV